MLGRMWMKKAIFAIIVLCTLISCATTNTPIAVGSANMEKTGQASGSIVLGMFGNADYGIATAARNGGITKIASVDVQIRRIVGLGIPGITGVGLIVTYTTTVTGE